jgi:hypothetical protein
MLKDFGSSIVVPWFELMEEESVPIADLMGVFILHSEWYVGL